MTTTTLATTMAAATAMITAVGGMSCKESRSSK